MNALATAIHAEMSQVELYALRDLIDALISPGHVAYAFGPGGRVIHRSGRRLDRAAAEETLAIHRATAKAEDLFGPDLAKAARGIAVHLHQAIALTFPNQEA